MITGALAFSNGGGLVAQDVAVVGPRANAIVIHNAPCVYCPPFSRIPGG